jgi:tetratricopeptide (TPR) repeat protein
MAEKVLERAPNDGEPLMASLEIEGLRLQMDAREMRLAEFARTEARLAGLAQRWQEVAPRNPGRAFQVYAELGQLNEKIGNKEQARRWYEKSLEGWRKVQEQKNMLPLYAQEPERVARLLLALPVHPTVRPTPSQP